MPGALLVDLGARTIQGLAVPYGRTGHTGGRHYRFLPGWLRLDGLVHVLEEHNNGLRAGRALILSEADVGLYCVLRINAGRRGDRLLSLAAGGVFGLSPGVRREQLRTTPAEPGVHLVERGLLSEITLTRNPAFEGVPCL